MKQATKRIAIAAEALSNAANVEIPSLPKSDAVLQMLGRASQVSNLHMQIEGRGYNYATPGYDANPHWPPASICCITPS